MVFWQSPDTPVMSGFHVERAASSVLRVFVLCEHLASVLVFCVPCALMSICLDPTHLVTCLLINFPQLLSLVTLLICSLYNLLVFAVPCWFVVVWCMPCVVSCPALPCPTLSNLVLSCPVLSCPALPACQSVFALRGRFCLFCLLLLIKSTFSSCNWVLALIHYLILTERTHHEEDLAEKGLAPSTTSVHTVQPPLWAHPPVQGPELLPSAGHWRKDVCPGVQRFSRGAGV